MYKTEILKTTFVFICFLTTKRRTFFLLTVFILQRGTLIYTTIIIGFVKQQLN